MQQVLAYNLSGEKQQRIRRLCEEMEIIYTSVPASWYGLPLGVLAEGERMTETSGLPCASSFADEMLVFVCFTDESLGRFLSLYRQAGIEPVLLKAVLTLHNITWDACRLRDELMKEYEAFRKENEEEEEQ